MAGKYTNAADIAKLFPEVDTTGKSAEDQEFYIRLAEAEIDGHIATRYTLPFSSTPQLIRDVAVELSFIKILEASFTADARSSNDWVQSRRENLDKLLHKIADGIVSLVDSAGGILTQRTDLAGISSDTSQYTPTHGHGNVVFEIVDPDRREDEDDARDSIDIIQR